MQPRPRSSRLERRPRLRYSRGALAGGSTKRGSIRGRAHPFKGTPPPPQGGRFTSFLRQHTYEIFRDALIALLAVVLTFTLDNQIATRQEVLENLRFVRDRSGDPASSKPFANMRLDGAALAGLSLGCTEAGLSSCATFRSADMSGTELTGTGLSNASLEEANLRGADLSNANLSGANLGVADLRGAAVFSADLSGATLGAADLSGTNLSGADLRGTDLRITNLSDANLTKANLSGTDLRGTDLRGVDLSYVCFDLRTQWPDGYQQPINDCALSEE